MDGRSNRGNLLRDVGEGREQDAEDSFLAMMSFYSPAIIIDSISHDPVRVLPG